MGWYGQSLDPAHQVDYGAGSRGLSGWWCVAAVGLGAGREGGTGKEGASNPCSLSLKLSLLSFNHEAFLATSPASECSIASVVIGPSTLQGNHDNGNKTTTQIHATPCFCCTTFRRRIVTMHTVHTRSRAGQGRAETARRHVVLLHIDAENDQSLFARRYRYMYYVANMRRTPFPPSACPSHPRISSTSRQCTHKCR